MGAQCGNGLLDKFRAKIALPKQRTSESLRLVLSLRETHDDLSAPPPIEICRVYLVVYSLVSIRTNPNRSVSQVYDQVNRL